MSKYKVHKVAVRKGAKKLPPHTRTLEPTKPKPRARLSVSAAKQIDGLTFWLLEHRRNAFLEGENAAALAIRLLERAELDLAEQKDVNERLAQMHFETFVREHGALITMREASRLVFAYLETCARTGIGPKPFVVATVRDSLDAPPRDFTQNASTTATRRARG